MPKAPPVYNAHGYIACKRTRERQSKKAHDRSRPNAAARGYDARWRRHRNRFIREFPLCRHCEDQGRVTPAREVDHIIPHKGDETLFWDQSNWQSLCRPCHSRKTASEDGGFGNQIKPS